MFQTPPSSCPPKEIPPRFLGAWSQSAYTLRQSLPLTAEDTPTFGSLLALVYREVGWEMGVVKRTLESHRINWGYFFDHNPFEPHCNSHPNNFIVLPPVSCLTSSIMAINCLTSSIVAVNCLTSSIYYLASAPLPAAHTHTLNKPSLWHHAGTQVSSGSCGL